MLDKFTQFVDYIDTVELAKIQVSLEAWVNDRDFFKQAPVIQVYAFPKRFEDDVVVKLDSDPEYVGMYVSVNTPDEQRTLEYSLPFKEKKSRWGGGENLPSMKQIWVLALPNGGWKDFYEPGWFPVRIFRGKTVHLPIALKPSKPRNLRNENTRDI